MKIHSLIYWVAIASTIVVACQSKSSAPAGAQPGPKNEEPETEQPAPESNADTASPASEPPVVVVTPAPVTAPDAPPLLPIVDTPLYDLDDGYNQNNGVLSFNVYKMNDTSGSLCKSDYYGNCRSGQTDFSQTTTWKLTLAAPTTMTIYNYGGTHTLARTLPTIHIVILDAAGRPVLARPMPCTNPLSETFTLNELPAGSYSFKFVVHTQELGKVIFGFKVRTT